MPDKEPTKKIWPAVNGAKRSEVPAIIRLPAAGRYESGC